MDHEKPSPMVRQMIAARSVALIKEAMAAGVDVNVQFNTSTPIFQATGRALAFLIKQGARVNVVRERDGCTPLGEACALGLDKKVQTLIAAGADVNHPGRMDLSPLTIAAFGKTPKHLAMVEALLAAGADPNVYRKSDYRNPLGTAALEGSPEVIAALLRAGANIEFGAGTNETALNAAVSARVVANAVALLAAGADPHARNATDFPDPSRRGKSAVELARSSTSAQIRELFAQLLAH